MTCSCIPNSYANDVHLYSKLVRLWSTHISNSYANDEHPYSKFVGQWRAPVFQTHTPMMCTYTPNSYANDVHIYSKLLHQRRTHIFQTCTPMTYTCIPTSYANDVIYSRLVCQWRTQYSKTRTPMTYTRIPKLVGQWRTHTFQTLTPMTYTYIPNSCANGVHIHFKHLLCCSAHFTGTDFYLWQYLTKNHAMRAYWGSECIAPRILKLGTRWSFTSRPLYPRGRAPDTLCTVGYVDSRAGLDGVVKREIPTPAGNQTPVFQPIALSLYWLSYAGSYWR